MPVGSDSLLSSSALASPTSRTRGPFRTPQKTPSGSASSSRAGSISIMSNPYASSSAADPLGPAGGASPWGSAPLTSSGFGSPTSPVRPGSGLPSGFSSSSGATREPVVHGAPGMGLLSPAEDGEDSAAGSGKGKGRQPPSLRVRITGLERNRKDTLIRFDANTNLPNFRLSIYRNMQRSYVEFQRFAEQAQLTSPQTIIPALPLPNTSAVSDEEDDRLVRIALQRWFTRVCEDPVLLKDDELRAFIESDFGYSPVPPPSARRSASTSAATSVFTAALSKVVRRGPLDEDDDLALAKGALEKLEERWGGAATAVGAMGKSRRLWAVASADVGARMISLSTVESDAGLQQAERKLGRSFEQLAGVTGAQAASENVVLSDNLGYQALNARAAKDALLQRTQLLEDSQTASKSAINKRRQVERLKASSSINPGKVDDAIAEMEDANTLETSLSNRLSAISQHLHTALRSHSRQTHDDVAVALLENARLTVGFHRHVLKELEALRPDISKIGSMAAAQGVRSAGPAPQLPNMSPSRSMPARQASSTYEAVLPPTNGGLPVFAGTQSMYVSSPTRSSSRSTIVERPRPPPGVASPIPSGPGPSGTGTFHSEPPLQASQGQGHNGSANPLGAAPQMGGMAQSMVLPGTNAQQQPAQARGGRGPRRLDERQAAKLLAGGF